MSRFNYACLVAVVLVILRLGSLSAAEPGPKGGFRNSKWGDHPSPQMRPIGTRAGMDAYGDVDRPSGRVAGIDTFLIQYLFWRGRFCRVDINWKADDAERATIVAILSREWGAPDESAPGLGVDTIESWRWFSRDRKTKAWLHRIDIVERSEEGLWQLIIQEEKCSQQAAHDSG